MPASVLTLLAAATATAIFARALKLPYPIAFVLGGAVFAFVPNMPRFALEPDLVFVLILPPLLFSGGWRTDWNAFRQNLRAISLLAIGLVIATTVVVAVVVHGLAPRLGWPAAFVLGAIVSPPDAVAASAVFERFKVPGRILTILEGEGLVNDATALVVYGFAVSAVMTGTFSPSSAALAFVGVSVGGIAIGIACGYVLVHVMIALRGSDLSDSVIDNVLAILTPYAVYLLAGAAHVSSVLATVAAGMYVSRRSSEIYAPEGRLTVTAVWQLLIFLLNAFAFLLVGIELRSLVADRAVAAQQVGLGAVVSVAVIVVRILWVYPGAFLPHLIPAVRRRETTPRIRDVFVVAWSGMRGVVSLAAALALPLRLGSGAPFPGRGAIVFTTFCVIFVTLVGQGLALIPLIRFLRLGGDDLERREVEVRVAALDAGIARLRALEPEYRSAEEWEVAGRIVAEYRYRMGHLNGRLDPEIRTEAAVDHRFQREALVAEHEEVLRMRDAGEIPDEIFRRIRYDLDLAAARLV